jgi:hypothetical protein
MRFLLVAALVLVSSSLFAQDKSSGCGVGWMVTRSMTTSGSFTRSVTNATFSNTLAMTSGTSGCARHDLVLIEKARTHFIANNILPLQLEVAMGSGERLAVLGKMFGCDSQIDEFAFQMRKSHSQIFKTSNPSQVLDEVKSIIQNDQNLKNNCIHS